MVWISGSALTRPGPGTVPGPHDPKPIKVPRAMAELRDQGERRSISTENFCLEFEWTEDRWVHSLVQASRDPRRVFAWTLEGDPGRDDPARVVSPTYQQLHFQGERSAIQTLLVGQAGPHHFSAVFAFEEDPDGSVRIGVDVADRCRHPTEALASTYTVGASSDELVEASPSAAVWDFGAGRLTFSATPPAQVALAEAGRRATQIQALAGADPLAPTRRYVYQWYWEPALRR